MFLPIRNGLDEALELLRRHKFKRENSTSYELLHYYFVADRITRRMKESKRPTSPKKVDSFSSLP